MERIPLHGKQGFGQYALVDDEDYPALSRSTWSAIRNGPNLYAYRGDGTRMHRLVAGTPPGMETDHINGDTLDNRRSNLRICTRAENGRNRRPTTGRALPKGVHRDGSRFRALIRVNRRLLHVGTYTTEAEASQAYNEAAQHHFGEFARLNPSA